MQEFDIVLILSFFRRTTYFLNIIKYLGKDFRIGLFPIPLHESLKIKHKTTQEDFVRKCIDRGAHFINSYPVSAKVTLFPQDKYLKEAFEHIHKNLTSSLKVAALTLAYPGLFDDFIRELNINKVLVVHKAFFDFLLGHRGNPEIFENREIVEVGLPYRKYILFPEFQTDYLMAMPSPFSFAHEKDKWDFMETVLSLFQKVSNGDTIVYKPHNAQDRDYFSDLKYRHLTRYLKVLPDSMISVILKKVAQVGLGKLSYHVGRLYTAFLYEKILDRVTPMERVTSNHNFAMEAFLPGVKKGVIGGLSNTIWGALFFELPFYNCVDIDLQDRNADNKLYQKDSSLLLDLNLKFFHVPYCNGELKFDSKYFDIIQESTRQGDLIGEIRNEMNKFI